jgi:hypothetical protein
MECMCAKRALHCPACSFLFPQVSFGMHPLAALATVAFKRARTPREFIRCDRLASVHIRVLM